MNQINYYKRVKNGKVIELHLIEKKDNCLISLVYPEPKTDETYSFDELVEISDLDTWLDIGNEKGLF